jgi:hypothetical protein
MNEQVNRPTHYRGLEFDAIDVIENFNLSFNLGNVIKYILRCRRKGKEIEDLQKAHWYLSREIERSLKEKKKTEET